MSSCLRRRMPTTEIRPNYLEADHLQRAIRQLLAGFGEVRYAIDGCGAPCFYQ